MSTNVFVINKQKPHRQIRLNLRKQPLNKRI